MKIHRSLRGALLLLLGLQRLAAADVFVVRDDLTDHPAGISELVLDALAKAQIPARAISAGELASRLDAAPDRGHIVLLADARRFPAAALLALDHFLKRGNHLVAVSGPAFSQLLTWRDGRWVEAAPPAVPPILESISPAYKLHRVHTVSLATAGGDARFPLDASVVGALPRSRGLGAEALRKWRQIPLAYALDANGARRAIVAHLLLNNAAEFAGSVWGHLGLSPEDVGRSSSWSMPLLVSMVRRIQGGVFLANAGSRAIAVAAGEPHSLGAFVAHPSAGSAAIEVDFSVRHAGQIVHASTHALAALPAAPEPASFVPGPDVVLPAGEYELTTTLASGGQTLDAITYPIRVIAYDAPAERDAVSVREGDFHRHGQRWYPLGMNYWPRYIAGLEPGDFSNAQWDAALYDPESVEEDLALARTLGLNLISTQYNRPEQAAPVMDLLARAHRHGLAVHLYLPGLDPLQQDLPRAAALMRAARLADSPALFAYDLGWEVRVGPRATRQAWDATWQQWVIDRYGSIEAAEKDWGYAPPRLEGTIAGASDEQLKQDGPWRVYVAAYRRFWDDTISRGYREVRAFIRSIDRVHLLGARSGYGGTGAEWIAEHLPFDLASGAKHLDFISPEHYEFSRNRTEFLKGAFTTAYARLVSAGKPVYWAEFGLPVAWQVDAPAYGLEPDPAALRKQADHFRDFIWAVHAGRAHGCAGWWWPAGYRVEEKSDFGIIGPDLSLRPAAEEVARAARWFHAPLPPLTVEGELLLDRDAYVTGYAGVYGAHSMAFAAQVEQGRVPQLRTAGTGTDSATTPLVAVGNVPATGHNPPKHLNAEFNYLRVNGRTVRDGDVVRVAPGRPVAIEASVGNTAEAGWLARPEPAAGAVYLVARSREQHWLAPLEADTPYLGDGRVTLPALSGPTEANVNLRFQMTAWGRSDFGEVIRVTLEPDPTTLPVPSSAPPAK